MERILYKQSEFAKMVGVHKNTVYRWVESGRIKSIPVGSVRMIPASEVERIRKGD